MICFSLLIDKISPSVNKVTFISVDYCKAIMHSTAVGPNGLHYSNILPQARAANTTINTVKTVPFCPRQYISTSAFVWSTFTVEKWRPSFEYHNFK